MTRFWITLDQGVKFVLDSIRRMGGGEVMVPKLPTMNIVDLAEAIAPECEVENIGIRPGEKIHEMLISEDDSRTALALADSFVIPPLSLGWDQAAWADGSPVTPGFTYTSDDDSWRIAGAELKAMAQDVSVEGH